MSSRNYNQGTGIRISNNRYTRSNTISNRELYKKSISGKSELDRHVENHFITIYDLLDYSSKLTKPQQDIINYFSVISNEISEAVSGDMVFTNTSLTQMASTGIDVMYRYLINNDMYYRGIDPGIDAFISLYERIKQSGGGQSIDSWCGCPSGASWPCHAACAVLIICIIILL